MARSPLAELRVLLALLALLAVACSPQPESGKGTDSGGGDSPGDTAPPLPPCNDDPFVTVEVGYAALCATHADGCVECAALQADWVEDYGLATPPERALASVALSDGCYHIMDGVDCPPQLGGCGIADDDVAACWGWPYQEAARGIDALSSISVGFRHACALDLSGTARCMGACENDSCVPPVDQFTQVVSGHDFSCGLDTTAAAQCWGFDAGTFGGRGDAWLANFSSWAAGPFESLISVPGDVCGVRGDGVVSCFPFDFGEVWPVLFVADGVASWAAIQDINNSTEAACALTAQGQVTCSGELSLIPSTNLDTYRFTTISAGFDRLCGVTVDGEIVCAVIGDTWAYCPFCTELFPDE